MVPLNRDAGCCLTLSHLEGRRHRTSAGLWRAAGSVRSDPASASRCATSITSEVTSWTAPLPRHFGTPIALVHEPQREGRSWWPWHEYRDGPSSSGQPRATRSRTGAAESGGDALRAGRAQAKSVIVRGRAEVVPGLDRDLARRLGTRSGPEESGPFLSWVDSTPDASESG
jgi:hypothetical protein